MTRRPRPPDEPICSWCKKAIDRSPWRSPIGDIPGGRWVVCGPLCPKRPEGVLVIADWRVAQ